MFPTVSPKASWLNPKTTKKRTVFILFKLRRKDISKYSIYQ